jgi:hypothetical protein
VIFGAPNDYTNFDEYQLGEDKFSRAAPMVRVDEGDSSTAVVNLNLFPLSDAPLQVCVRFKLPEKSNVSKRSDDLTTPDLNADTQVVWYRSVPSTVLRRVHDTDSSCCVGI